MLRKVSDYYMSIPSFALEKVLRVLGEIGFVRIVERGRKIEKVIPNIPAFDDVYSGIGQFAASEFTLNSHEQAILRILVELRDAPRNRDSMRTSLGIESKLYDRCVTIGSASGIISEHQARGRPMLISPFYFADNLQGLADAAVAVGASAIQSTLKKVQNNQGWPLSLVIGTRCGYASDRFRSPIHRAKTDWLAPSAAPGAGLFLGPVFGTAFPFGTMFLSVANFGYPM